MNTAPVQKEMCKSCPFNSTPEARTEFRTLLVARAVGMEGSGAPECHSTGKSAEEFIGKSGIPPKLCRGARNISLNHFYRIGFIKAPTDAAWAEKCNELNL
jgi:hypothetical protein